MKAALEDMNGPATTLREGKVLDAKYRVDYLLGQGGMAEVWAGTNMRTGKRVALKVLLASLRAIPGVDSLFQREGLAASRVNHPNVVTVFDVIEHQGTACIVMELLTGESLGSYLARSGPLNLNDASGLLLPAMRGVSAAHAQGVIHRDLKPQNIFVCVDPDGRTVTTKVLDFGISIIVERAREPAVRQSSQVVMGTPAYMAPEQISGFAPTDERTDVYGFGVLFYECLTGNVPFPDAPGPALYEHILHDPFPPLTRLRPDLPLGLVQTIETALAKDPAHRYANLNLMAAAFEFEVLSATPVPRGLKLVTGASPSAPPHAASGMRRTAVEAAPPNEPSGEHQATRFMVSFPLETAAGQPGEPSDTLLVRGETSSETSAPTRLVPRLLRSQRVRVSVSVGLILLVAGTAFAWRRLDPNGRQASAQNAMSPPVVHAKPPKPETPSPPLVEMLAPTPIAESDADSAPSMAESLIMPALPSEPEAQAPVEVDADLRASDQAPRARSKRAPARRLDSRAMVDPFLLSPPPLQPRPVPSSSRSRAGFLSSEDF